ncbi:MAG: methylmalonyl-CoA mutase subunit beta [Verrucomicrobia bacterium]|nr:methylmalonyl-CoA mutase subunit beta [Verrucomicrobiota bacterium]
MIPPAQAEPLLAEFPEHTYEQWHQAAEALLKGASFDQRLVSKTYEDITIQPLYRSADIANLEHRKHLPGAGSHVRGSHPSGFLKTGWEVSQELVTRCPAKFNQLALEGLHGGQSELNIPMTECGLLPAGLSSPGLTLRNLSSLHTALNGIDLSAIATFWRAGSNTLPVAALYFAAARHRGLDLKHLRGCFENDPLGDLALHGTLTAPLATRLDHLAALTHFASASAPGIQTISVRGDVYHNGGGSATQELGYAIATLVSYLEELQTRGVTPATAFHHVRLCLAVGSDYFMEIAKLRAARWLLSKVAATYGVTSPDLHLHASTSRWNKTTYDAHTNMLRVTAEAFAAVVAGVDSLHLGPYDEIVGTSDGFSRRIARNIHSILREECGLDRVIDPAGGSNYIEWLTDQVAAKSWAIFQDVEHQGGLLAGLESGGIQSAIAAVCHAKHQNIRRRKDKVVGSNLYPDLKGRKLAPKISNITHEKSAAECVSSCGFQPQASPSAAALVTEAIAAAAAGAATAEIAAALLPQASGPGRSIRAIPQRRAAEEYEALRDAAVAFAEKTGAPPAILQLNFGPSSRYRLRADWTASFFEAAGFAIDGTRDFNSIADATAAVAAGKASIAVITSDDATYPETVAPLATAVKAVRPDLTLLVAGAPGDHEAAWRAAGVDHFVNVRSNNYELNQQLLKQAGVL